MADFPTIANVDQLVICPGSPQSVGGWLNGTQNVTSINTAWQTANKAAFIPFSVYAPITIVKMFVVNGATVSGNIDVGIYDAFGARLVSKGSTAQSGTSTIQTFDITDTLLQPGLYYMAIAMDNTTGTLLQWTPTTNHASTMGLFEQATAFPLPSSFTAATYSMNRFPQLCLTQRTVV